MVRAVFGACHFATDGPIPPMSRFLFPRWSNALLPFILVVGATAPLYAVLIVAYGFSPKTLDGHRASSG